MKRPFKIGMVALCAIFMTYCSTEKTSPQAEEIGLASQNEDTFEGALEIENSAVSYSIKATSELTFDVKVIINDKEIDATIDYGDESLDFDGHDVTLTTEEKGVLLDMGQAISTYLLDQKDGDISMAEYSLLSLIEYWAKSPPNYRYTKRKVNSPDQTLGLKSRNEGIKCIKKNTTVTAQYDDRKGNHSDRVKVGSTARKNYECMGRCGAGCGRWWIPSAWTKDCLDHDQCSNVNNASGGGSDRNCGDEFNEAADDYVFGVIRGCRG